MHENCFPLPNYYQIGLSWQIRIAAAIANPHLPYHATHNHFWLGAPRTNPAHYLAALVRIEYIHFLSLNVR